MRIRRGRPKGVLQAAVADRHICLSCKLNAQKSCRIMHSCLMRQLLFIFFNLSVSYADSSPSKGATDNP